MMPVFLSAFEVVQRTQRRLRMHEEDGRALRRLNTVVGIRQYLAPRTDLVSSFCISVFISARYVQISPVYVEKSHLTSKILLL